MVVQIAAAGQHLGEPAAFADREHDDRDAVVAHQRDGRGVHDLQVARQHFVIGEPLVAGGGGVLLRIGGVDAVDLRALEQRVAAHLGGAQRGGGVGGEERIAGAGGENHDAALLHVAHGAAADVGLAHGHHRDRRQHARVAAEAFDRVLHGQRVHHRRQHAHVVGAGALHALGRALHAAEDVAAADDQAHFGARTGRLEHLRGDAVAHA